MRKKLFCLLLVFVLVLSSTGIAAFAGQPDRAYTYEDEEAVPSTNLFKVEKVIDETVMGTDQLMEPAELFVDKSDRVFIMDHYNEMNDKGKKTGKVYAKVIILNKDYSLFKELREFKYKEETLHLAKVPAAVACSSVKPPRPCILPIRKTTVFWYLTWKAMLAKSTPCPRM